MRKTGKARRARKAAGIGGDLMLAPLVATMRIPLMVMEAQSNRPFGTETVRSVSEKTEAMTQGAIAAQMSLMWSAAGFWPEALSGRVPSLLNGDAAQQFISAALKPASRTVRANFRRLSGKG